MTTTTDKIVLFIAQGAYSGRVPKAPGTAGTVVGVALYLLVSRLSLPWYGAVLAGGIVLGTWAAGRAERLLGTKDHQSIVIDEIAGYFVAMLFLPAAWWTVMAGFVLFRFFDIVKPWPIGKLQAVAGGPGVMLDDLGAGVYANVVLQTAGLLLHQL